MPPKDAAPEAPQYVLYVTTLKPCTGSAEAERLLQGTPGHEGVVLVQDIKALKAEDVPIPAWLKGTPTIVHISSREVNTGTAALRLLTEILQDLKASTAVAKRTATEMDLTCADNNAQGSWEVTEEDDQTGDQFEMEVGCDPNTIPTNKINSSDLEDAMRARGITMSTDTPGEEQME